MILHTTAPASGAPTGILEWAICPYPVTGDCTGYPGGDLQLPTPSVTQIEHNRNRVTITVLGGQNLPPGFYSVNANYEGNASLQSSSSDTSHVLITQASTITSVVLRHNPVKDGGGLALKAVVFANSRASDTIGAPSGTVTFTINGESGDMLTCSGPNPVTISTNEKNQGIGKCVIAPGELTTADSPYSFSVVYSGDTNYTGSNVSGEVQVVNPGS